MFCNTPSLYRKTDYICFIIHNHYKEIQITFVLLYTIHIYEYRVHIYALWYTIITEYMFCNTIIILEYRLHMLCNLHHYIVICITYGKLASGAESHYEICCFFPQNVRTLHALESSIFIGFLCRLLCFSDLDLVTTLS